MLVVSWEVEQKNALGQRQTVVLWGSPHGRLGSGPVAYKEGLKKREKKGKRRKKEENRRKKKSRGKTRLKFRGQLCTTVLRA